MKDDFSRHASSLTSPPAAAETIIPDNEVDLAYATRALYVGEGGDVAVQLMSGETVTLANMQAGTVYPMRVRRVLASGTTASFLVGLR